MINKKLKPQQIKTFKQSEKVNFNDSIKILTDYRKKNNL